MKTLLVLDSENYTDEMTVEERFCVRAIIFRDGRLAAQQSARGDYKLIGGGMEPGEDYRDALDREVREEAGLVIDRDDIHPYGEILEMRRDLFDQTCKYVCHTRFYKCEVGGEKLPLHMTASELAKGFHLVWVTPEDFIAGNRRFLDQPWTLRDTRFVELMCKDRIRG